MKLLIAILNMVFVTLGLHAQTKLTTITGEIVNRQSKYVYLGVEKKVYTAKITNNHFELNLPKVEGFMLGTLFFWSDSLSNEQASQMFKNRDNDYRSIAIENLHIIVPKITKDAVVKGGGNIISNWMKCFKV